jgi:uncharacterized membrane protein
LEPKQRGEKKTQTTYDDRHLRARKTFAWVIAAIAVVAVIALIAALVTRSYPYSPTMQYYGYPFFGWWFFPFGFILFFLFIFFIGRLIFWGGGGWGWRRGYYYHYGDAREILRQRYARSEITKDQFDQMMRDLEQH